MNFIATSGLTSRHLKGVTVVVESPVVSAGNLPPIFMAQWKMAVFEK